MMRMTPFRLITLQCSQIGLTLLRTFTDTPLVTEEIAVKTLSIASAAA
jgi:hypothetical protein